jgi:transposase
VKNNISLKNHLHSILTHHYPNYRTFFRYIDGDTALAFFARYPSPVTLANTTVEELAAFLKETGRHNFGEKKAQEILDSLQDTAVPFQELRDISVQSTIRQIRFNLEEIKGLEVALADVLAWFDCPLTSMNGVGTVCAAQLLSVIGDIKRFPTSAKLARYSGVAPVTYASGQKEKQFANKRGDRELNSLLHQLAVRLITTPSAKKTIINPYFYDYYHKKQGEGKTKKQALKCVQRRLVNIIWNMLTFGREYENPAMVRQNNP